MASIGFQTAVEKAKVALTDAATKANAGQLRNATKALVAARQWAEVATLELLEMRA